MLIGHEKLAKDFKQLAQNGRLAHGYLFFGQPRVGKKLFALSLANFLETGNFTSPSQVLSYKTWEGEPSPISDGKIMEGMPKNLADFLAIEQDEKRTIGIDQIRALKRFLWQKPFASPRRTAVINNSEAMTGEAQNAILKIAEESPESSLIIIIASDYERLLPTLQSRLQKIYFAPVARPLVEKWLKETVGCNANDAKRFAEASFGQPGLAKMLASDNGFQSLCQAAEKFLKSGFWDRRNIIKAMLEDEKFNFSVFLETLLILVSKNAVDKKNSDLWHRISALRRDGESYNVNPRLQLESLLGGF